MKRRIINCMLAFALLLPVTGGFTSCKDTDEDQFNDLKKEQYDLDSKIKELNKSLEDLKKLQEACKENCKQMLDLALAEYTLKKDFDAYKDFVSQNYATLQQYVALQGTVTAIQNAINTINQTLEAYDNRFKTVEQKMDAADIAIAQLKSTVGTVQTTLSGLQSTVATMGTNLTNLTNKVGNIELTVNGMQTSISNLQNTVGELTTNLTALTGTVTSLQSQVAPIIADWSVVKQQALDAYTWVNTNKALVEGMNTTLNELTTVKIPGMESDISTLKSDVSTLKSDLATVTEDLNTLSANMRDLDGQINGKGGVIDCIAIHDKQIEKLRSDLDALLTRFTALENRLNSLVTGIILQGTVNPVFGTMSLPINVQSNVVMAYYGYNDYGRKYDFPTDRPDPEFDNHIVITDEDWEMLTLAGSEIKEYFTVNQGPLLDTEAGNAGRVYVTVNPNNVNFEGVTLPIVNSRDEESGIKLTPLRKSDEELRFGYGRANDVKNGFYEADATLTAEEIEKVKINIEPGLKSAMKDVLTDRSKKDFAVLLKKVYDQFNGILPANGLKAAWTVNEQPFAVYSQYNLAATAFKPLSFKFLQGQTLRQLPIITPLSGFEFDMSKFTFNIDIPKFTINTEGLTMDLNLTFTDIKINYEGKIQVTIDDYPVVDENGTFLGTETKVFTADGIDDLIAEINESLQTALQTNADRWNKEIQDQFDKTIEKLAKQIQDQVDEMMKKVEGQINDNIKNMLDKIGDEINDKVGNYINKANNLINKYNSAANRINEYIKNANNYLQVTMLMQSADGMFHNVSNSAAMPSPFVINSGDALTLYLTTYTGEIVVPCLKKYVGVTNVFKGSASAQAGDADCLAQLKAANSTEFMNTALSGDQRRVAFSGKSGYVYELVYQALDYHGYTSTRKFYVEVR